LPHASVYRRLKDGSLILNCRTLEDVIPGIGHRLLHSFLRLLSLLIGLLRVMPRIQSRLGNNMIRLMSELSGEFAVPFQYFIRRVKFLAVPRAMGRDLRSSCTFPANFLQVAKDLFPARARCVEIFLAVALNLRLTMFAAFDLITQPVQPQGEFRTIDGCHVLLRLEKTALLKRARLAVLTLRHVEDDRVRVKLGCCVAIHGASSIVLEGRGDEFSGCLRRMDVADAGLGIPLQFSECDADTFAVRVADAVIATHKGGQRDRLWRRERGIPSRAMFDACNFLAALVLVGSGRLMLDKLRAALWMLALAEPRKVLGSYRTSETPFTRQATSPFAVHLRVTAPVVLFLRRELARMIRLRLAR